MAISFFRTDQRDAKIGLNLVFDKIRISGENPFAQGIVGYSLLSGAFDKVHDRQREVIPLFF
jgi:hypothetical protein